MKTKFLITAFAVILIGNALAACDDPARPGVDWSYCNKGNANLQEANFDVDPGINVLANNKTKRIFRARLVRQLARSGRWEEP